ncbi:hypothetical protein PoB_000788400 [Plakobranchus ocellatus]|uniref:Uncharacterized protein n=1 Tax=Plakobranchus ocellatus TaxID=259542 RepID=A0AAV3YGF1_9GAST|nr:hypothetical protein PoB_000788400 [Plakobranchus ocellatus]
MQDLSDAILSPNYGEFWASLREFALLCQSVGQRPKVTEVVRMDETTGFDPIPHGCRTPLELPVQTDSINRRYQMKQEPQ